MAIILVLALYLLPMIIAISRKLPNVGSVVVINILLGWTVIGWIVALAMSLGSPATPVAQVIIQNSAGFGTAAPTQDSQPAAGVIWDHARQAYLYRDPVTGRWLILGPTGAWSPLSAIEPAAQHPPPPPL